VIKLDRLLNFFYATMIVYMPIYLHLHVGLPWEKLGIIFTIMLVPFVLLDFLLGWIADSWWGEKELLVTGIIITAFATLMVPLLNSQSIILWGTILFLTRVGAATIEVMKESYLFKQIDGKNIDEVFLSRNTYSLAYIIAPMIAMVWLALFPYQYLFGFLGIIMLLGLPTAISLKDTR
jgi:MFS-type transporter involved in bile tolerance (Atg22 family)